jgi:hypothetical protein
MPQSIQNNFVKELKPLVDTNKLDSLKRYYFLLRKKINDVSDKDIFKYHSIADRLTTTRYFYFPTEWNTKEMNCFERSASLYIAFHELYPESNPSLISITDKYKNVHAAVLFTHNNKLWGGDPSFGYFGEIQLTHEAMIVPLEIVDDKKALLQSLSLTNSMNSETTINNPTTECKIPFEKINTITGKSLENLVDTLRSQPGIIDFLYKSGQRVSQSWSGLIFKSLFMKITPDGNIISDIRVSGDSFSEKDACLRLSFNPLTKKQNKEFFRYSKESWGKLLSPAHEKLSLPSEHRLGDYTIYDGPIAQFKDVIYYLSNVKNNFSYEELKDFSRNPIAQRRFKAIIQSAKEIDDATYMKSLHYLRSRFGPAKDLSPNNSKGMILTTKNLDDIDNFGSKPDNYDNLSVDEQLRYGIIHLKNLLEEDSLASIPPMIKLFDDSKKYIKEASKYIINNF